MGVKVALLDDHGQRQRPYIIETMHSYRPHGSGKLHQLLENPTCTPMPTVYPLQIRPVFVFVMIRA